MSHLEKDLELNGFEAPDEMQINTVTQQATQQNPEKPKPTCHHCKKPGQYRNQSRHIKRDKEPARKNTNSAGTNNNNIFGQTNPNSNNKIPTIPMQTLQRIKKTEVLDLSIHPVRPVEKLTIPQRNVTLEQTQRTDCLSGSDDQKDKIKSNREMPKATQRGMFKL